MTPLGIEPATFRLVTKCPHRIPPVLELPPNGCIMCLIGPTTMEMCGVWRLDFPMHNLHVKCWRVTFVHNPEVMKADELKLLLAAFAELLKETVSHHGCPPVRMERLGSHWTDFHKILLSIFRKSVEKIPVSIKSGKYDGNFA